MGRMKVMITTRELHDDMSVGDTKVISNKVSECTQIDEFLTKASISSRPTMVHPFTVKPKLSELIIEFLDKTHTLEELYELGDIVEGCGMLKKNTQFNSVIAHKVGPEIGLEKVSSSYTMTSLDVIFYNSIPLSIVITYITPDNKCTGYRKDLTDDPAKILYRALGRHFRRNKDSKLAFFGIDHEYLGVFQEVYTACNFFDSRYRLAYRFMTIEDYTRILLADKMKRDIYAKYNMQPIEGGCLIAPSPTHFPNIL